MSGDVRKRAVAILNQHCEYMDGVTRGQRVIGTGNALRAIEDALTSRDAEVAALRKALEPMIRWADYIVALDQGGGGAATLALTDAKSARAALGEGEG